MSQFWIINLLNLLFIEMIFFSPLLSVLIAGIRYLFRRINGVYIMSRDGVKRYLPCGTSIKIKNNEPYICQDEEECQRVEDVLGPGEKICDDRDCLLKKGL